MYACLSDGSGERHTRNDTQDPRSNQNQENFTDDDELQLPLSLPNNRTNALPQKELLLFVSMVSVSKRAQ